MKLDTSKLKAYGGAVGAGGGYLATESLSDNIVVILVWLMSLVGEPPIEVAQAITFLIKVAVTMGIGYFITFWSPPNRVSAAMYTEAIREEASRTREL